MTCKDCYHCPVCCGHDEEAANRKYPPAEKCRDFKDKSRIVELPRAAGDADWGKIINCQRAEIERLHSENEILSKNAAEAFQEGLNENRKLFTEEILKEFAHFLIDRAEGRVIHICDLHDFVKEFKEK